MPATPTPRAVPGDARRGGFALMMVILILAVTAAVTGATITLGANHLLVNRYHMRNDRLEAVAQAGLEEARAQLNGVKDLYPDTGYATLESNADVLDGSGNVIPGVKRWVYAGPTGITSGQYGVYGMLVAVTRDEGGGVAVRRLGVSQESFAKFAYFTDVEPSNISFGGGDQIFGPVHTNDYLKIYSSGATFHDEARTAKTVSGGSYGTFKKGYEENVGVIPMPETADLVKLESQAVVGGTFFDGDPVGDPGGATTRIEFVAIDLNGDGDTTDEDEGFIRVYQSSTWQWVSAVTSQPQASNNCGDWHDDGLFYLAKDAVHASTLKWHWKKGWTGTPPPAGHDEDGSLHQSDARCYLGGAEALTGNVFTPNDGIGEWLPWGGTVSPLLAAAGRSDGAYLFPITRALNPSFKGVIYVDGKVIVSGKLRGRVTVASTDDIIIGDDITYATDPGLGTCDDMLGLFADDDVVVSNNTLNTPQYVSGWTTLDETKDEFIHGVVLALDNFYVENYNNGPDEEEACESQSWGRGCLYLSGGIIQKTRGAVGTSGGTGYVKRYSYDACAASQPPPYFPTTGHFVKGQAYPVDPVGFSAASYYAQFQAN